MNCNKKCECKLKHIVEQDIRSDWSNKIIRTKGDVLCLRGGVYCIKETIERWDDVVVENVNGWKKRYGKVLSYDRLSNGSYYYYVQMNDDLNKFYIHPDKLHLV